MAVTRFDPVIPPGGRGEVALDVNTWRLKGKIQKEAKVISNDPKHPVVPLKLKAVVKQSFDITPKSYKKFTTKKGEAWTSEFKISSQRKKDFKIVSVGTSAKTIKATYKLLKDNPREGNLYSLMVTVSPEAPIGDLKGAVKISTDIPDAPPAVISLMGKIEGPIRYHPEELTFVSFIPEAQISRIVDLFKADGGDFQIKEVKGDSGNIECKTIPMKNGRGHVLVAVWTGGKVEKILRGKLQVFTNDKEQSRIDIPYTVFPSGARNRER